MHKYLPILAIAVGILTAAFAYQWYQSYSIPTYNLPSIIDSSIAYPVVFVFPAMGGDAVAITQEIVGRDAIIVRFHEPNYTLPTFSVTLRRAEHQAQSELTLLRKKYRIDTSMIVCSGFSLGGDVAFALALRHTIPITHTLIMGSRCTYRIQNFGTIQRSTQFSFIVGSNDERILQHNLAIDYLRSNHCSVHRRVIHGLSHSVPRMEEIMQAFKELIR